jgi:hypothetical protein
MIFYVCFDPSDGKIVIVSNEADDLNANLEVDKDTYVKFMQGEFSISDYFVLIQPQSFKKFKLTKKELIKTDEYINYSIKPFEKISETREKNIFYVIQDNKLGKWKGYADLEEDYRTFLSNTEDYFGKNKSFFITESGNPNKFLGKISVTIDKFLENKEFTIGDIDIIMQKTKELSLYSNIVHEKYMHVTRD